MYAVLLVHFVSTLASLLKKNNKLSRGAAASLMSSAERNVKGRGTVVSDSTFVVALCIDAFSLAVVMMMMMILLLGEVLILLH